MYINAIDLSKHQGSGKNKPLPNYNLIPSNIQLVIARASVGSYYRDPTYEYHKAQSARTSRDFGGYCVFHPHYSLSRHQENIRRVFGDNPPRLISADLEKGKAWNMPSRQKVTGRTLEFMYWLDEYYENSVIDIYTALWYWDNWIIDNGQFTKWPLHVAAYPYDNNGTQFTNHAAFIKTLPRKIKLPGKWTSYIARQFSEKGKMAGISASVDLNIFERDYYDSVFGDPIPVPDEWKIKSASEKEIILVR